MQLFVQRTVLEPDCIARRPEHECEYEREREH